MTITTFDKRICKALADEALALLQPLAAKHGVRIALGNATYDEGTIKQGFVFSAVTADGRKVIGAADRRLMNLYGIDPDAVHTDSKGITHHITGVKSSGAVTTDGSDGRSYQWKNTIAQKVFPAKRSEITITEVDNLIIPSR